MSRTTHHTRSTRARRPGRAWLTVVLDDLRHSSACPRAARRRRPRPEAVRRVVEVRSFPRAHHRDREVARPARLAERRALRCSRDDVAPARHRHSAVHHAW
ncbi:hypothetical protein [Saccharothrix syringae]|uniref:Uncharacterized protein n=1 Tax=Saccharothrix syringae TaxID=103733 RepID=A0A5Q0GU05_SACSY|nr:hypothetical protein [Saccharothrix syringae]QFZ17478.1 hypothetical protein EKG83_08315 [Saccharothrix syringae]